MENKPKILIIGSNGLLAFDLIRIFGKDCKVIEANRADFDITNKTAVKRFINSYKPNVIINTAALVKVDACELNPHKAFETNAIGALNIAKAAKDVGALNVYISTNYVFD